LLLTNQLTKSTLVVLYNTNGSYITGGPLYDMGRTLFNAYTKILVEERKIIEDGALSIVQRLSLPLLLQLQELVR
jgi:hypothetical protein